MVITKTLHDLAIIESNSLRLYATPGVEKPYWSSSPNFMYDYCIATFGDFVVASGYDDLCLYDEEYMNEYGDDEITIIIGAYYPKKFDFRFFYTDEIVDVTPEDYELTSPATIEEAVALLPKFREILKNELEEEIKCGDFSLSEEQLQDNLQEACNDNYVGLFVFGSDDEEYQCEWETMDWNGNTPC